MRPSPRRWSSLLARQQRGRRDRGATGWTGAAICVAALGPPLVASAQASLQGLGQLGGLPTAATAISADGSVVVGTSGAGGFRWTAATGMVGLGFQARAVSGDGSVVVGNGFSQGIHQAVRWTAADGSVGLVGLAASCPDSSAQGVSADGSIVASIGYPPLPGGGCGWATASRWTAAGGMVPLDPLGPSASDGYSFASGVSADGTAIVGVDFSATTTQAFRWTANGGTEGLGFLPGGTYSSGSAISADGSVVVGEAKSPDEPYKQAFRWTAAGGMVEIPGVRYATALAVSGDGSVVVGEADSAAFVWDAKHGMRSLVAALEQAGVNVYGWRLAWASGISADGLTVVGSGADANGVQQAFRAVLAEALCQDSLDNDGDGLTDFPADPGCSSSNDGSEETPPETPPAKCSDGIDNDRDGLVDFPADPSCASADSNEWAMCQDGLDNDGDGTIDFDGGASMNRGNPLAPPDPKCVRPSDNREVPTCGLGGEIALVVGPLLRWSRRRTAARVGVAGSSRAHP